MTQCFTNRLGYTILNLPLLSGGVLIYLQNLKTLGDLLNRFLHFSMPFHVHSLFFRKMKQRVVKGKKSHNTVKTAYYKEKYNGLSAYIFFFFLCSLNIESRKEILNLSACAKWV